MIFKTRSQARYGWSHQTVQHHAAYEFVPPLATPQARILVADLLP